MRTELTINEMYIRYKNGKLKIPKHGNVWCYLSDDLRDDNFKSRFNAKVLTTIFNMEDFKSKIHSV